MPAPVDLDALAADHPLREDTSIDLNDPAMKALIDSFERTEPVRADDDPAAQDAREAADAAIDVDAPPAATVPPAAAPATTDDGEPPKSGMTAPEPINPPDDDLPPAAAIPDDAELTRLRGLDAWARGLNPETVAAFDAVESGRAVALPREEIEAFRAWKATGSQYTSPLAQPNPQQQTPTAPEFDEFIDPATKALYSEIQELKATLNAQRQDSIQSSAAAQQAQFQAHINQRYEVFEKAFVATGAEFGLTPAEVNLALQYAGSNQLIGQINNELTQWSPTGAVIAEPDPSLVARTTVERAIYAIPDLRDRAIQAQVDKRIEAERADIILTNEKKNRAGSLSSAPTAATSMEPIDVRQMSKTQLEAAIAAELRRTTPAS